MRNWQQMGWRSYWALEERETPGLGTEDMRRERKRLQGREDGHCYRRPTRPAARCCGPRSQTAVVVAGDRERFDWERQERPLQRARDRRDQIRSAGESASSLLLLPLSSTVHRRRTERRTLVFAPGSPFPSSMSLLQVLSVTVWSSVLNVEHLAAASWRSARHS